MRVVWKEGPQSRWCVPSDELEDFAADFWLGRPAGW